MRGSLKQSIQSLARDFGFDIRRRQPNLVDFLKSRSINLVLDVGANVGQFALNIRRLGYAGRIVSFEPVSEPFLALSETSAHDALWSARNIALGNSTGRAKINVSTDRQMSSMVEQSDLARRSEFQMQVVRVDEVEIRRLDDAKIQFSGCRPFLKIDAQGYEREVLDGATESLSFFLGIVLELPLANLYKTWQFHEAIEYMHRIGFVPAQFNAVNFLSEYPPSLLEVDCVFRRRDNSQ
jgi:FkbM family methyltransferase